MDAATDTRALPGSRRAGWRSGALAALVAVVVASGCEVTNPGPVQDEFLSDPESHAALVAGAGFNLAIALMELSYAGALPSREIFPSGQIGAAGWPVINQGGHWEDGDGPQWNNLQEARFIAEDALRRFIEEGAIENPATSPHVAQAHVWAGYALRVLGEHYCYVTFDGGGVETAQAAFERAEQHFTKGMEVAAAAGETALRDAARAGRAQVRAWLGDWAGAVADAQQVADDFVYASPMDGDDAGARNALWWATANKPYRTFSIWSTFYEGYYQDVGDPRTPSGTLSSHKWSTGALSGYGQVPFVQQRKYGDAAADIRLSSGSEMRLLQAEALLRDGSWQQAMELINAVRARNVSDVTGEPLEAHVATSAGQAWAFLKRERGIELWMEGRRFGEMRRWEDQGAPGALDWPDYESISTIFSANPRSRCFGIPDNERRSNPNLTMTLPTDGLWATGSP